MKPEKNEDERLAAKRIMNEGKPQEVREKAHAWSFSSDVTNARDMVAERA